MLQYLSQWLTEQNKYFCHEMSFLFYMQPAQTTHYLTEKSAFTFAIHAKWDAKKSSDHFHKRAKKNTTQKKKIYKLIKCKY